MVCEYKNCKKEFEGRPNKRFCSIHCKRNSAKYRQREKNKINEINEI